MTGQDFQDKLDALVADMTGKASIKTTVLMRSSTNEPALFVLQTNASGVVNQNGIDGLQSFIDTLKPVANTYEAEFAPVKSASETFRTARAVHQVLIDDSTTARTALNDALAADPNYQTADAALKAAQTDPAYIAARDAYAVGNISENFGNLSDAKGKYQAV